MQITGCTVVVRPTEHPVYVEPHQSMDVWRYYPDSRIYYHTVLHYYYYPDGNSWRRSRILPPGIVLNSERAVVLEEAGAPYLKNDFHQQMHPPKWGVANKHGESNGNRPSPLHGHRNGNPHYHENASRQTHPEKNTGRPSFTHGNGNAHSQHLENTEFQRRSEKNRGKPTPNYGNGRSYPQYRENAAHQKQSPTQRPAPNNVANESRGKKPTASKSQRYTNTKRDLHKGNEVTNTSSQGSSTHKEREKRNNASKPKSHNNPMKTNQAIVKPTKQQEMPKTSHVDNHKDKQASVTKTDNADATISQTKSIKKTNNEHGKNKPEKNKVSMRSDTTGKINGKGN